MTVGIVGLGLSGIRTAMLLEAAGHEVICVEARDRVGGRCETVQREGGFFEAGGEWIDPHNDRIINLLFDELGQFPVADEPSRGRMSFGGVVRTDDDDWPALEALSQALDEAVDEYLLDLEQPPWSNVLYPHLDQLSVKDLVKKVTHDPSAAEALSAILRSEEGEEIDQVSLLAWLCGYEFYRERGGGEGSPLRFPEGAQVFCEKLFAKVRGERRFGWALERVEVESNGVTLHGASEAISVDKVVLTAPGEAIRRITFDPPLGDAKEIALSALPLGRTIKVSMEYSERWWESRGWGGRFLSDGLVQQCWDGSRGDTAVLLAYICGDRADEIRRMHDPALALVEELSKEYPEAKSKFMLGKLHDWVGDPFAGGGFPHAALGDVLEQWEARIAPVGPIHFAGDATSVLIGYMEGALESAERVAQEIGPA